MQAFASSLTTFGWFVVVLGVLVFVHEFGHFLMARWLRIGVRTFAIGFGPRIVGFVRGGTDYCLRIFPLGGYVKLAGENPDEALTGSSEEFLSRSKWERFLVYLMGPVMNVLLAVVLMWVVLIQGAEVPTFQDQPVVLGGVIAGSPAQKAGLQARDRVARVAGKRTDTWEQFYVAIGSRPNRLVPLTVWREGRELSIDVTPEAKTRFEVGDIGAKPDVHPNIRAVVSGQPAEKAGLKVGDVVTAVNGALMTFQIELRDAIAKHPAQPITLAVLRNGTPLEIAITPLREGNAGRIGVQIGDQTKTITPTVGGALWMSLERNYQFGGLIFQTLVGLVTRDTSPRQLMGPVGIAQLSGEYAAAGLFALLTLMASISLNLGVLNLLPIPILDGGHIFIMAVEGMFRRDLSLRVKERILLGGFFVLMLLMVTTVYNDLTRVAWIERFMFWR